MKIDNYSIKITNPIVTSLSVAILIPTLFIIASMYLEYSTYRNTFINLQNSEIENVFQKSNKVTDEIRKFLKLTLRRINAVNGDDVRIQSILNTSETFGIRIKLPSIKKLTYLKLKSPSLIISRFGSKQIDSSTLGNIKSNRDSLTISVEENILIGKAVNFNDSGDIEGLLEAEVDYQEIKKQVGSYSLIEIGEFTKTRLNSEGQQLFEIYKHPPDNFIKYVSINKSRYTLFLSFALLMLILLVVGSVYFENIRKSKFKSKIKTLEREIYQLKDELRVLKNNYSIQNQELEYQQTTFNAYKNFHGKLDKRKREHTNYLIRSLDVISKSLSTSTICLSNEERYELIQGCIKAAHSLSLNSMSSLKTGKINITDILSEIEKYYAEKIYKTKINFTINGVDEFMVEGDSFLIESILLSLIGKAVFKVPRNGDVKINYGVVNNQPFIEIQDNGFTLGESTEKLLRKSLTHYLSENNLKEICSDNGFTCDTSKSSDGYTKVTLLFSPYQTRASNDNIVTLFKKNV